MFRRKPTADEVTGCELPAVAQVFEPLFEVVPEEKRRLGGFILLALAAHLVAFFFLKVVEVKPFIAPTPRISVSLATPELASPEMLANLDYWNRIHDPSQLIIPREPLLSDVRLPSAYGPTAAGGEWDLLTVDETGAETYDVLPERLLPLEERVGRDLHAPPAQPFRPAALVEPGGEEASATVVVFDPDLQDRVLGAGPRLADPALETLTAERGTTDLRLAVGPDGLVRHVLVETGSGNGEIDARAVAALRGMRFHRVNAAGLTWGTARVFWHFVPAEAPAKP